MLRLKLGSCVRSPLIRDSRLVADLVSLPSFEDNKAEMMSVFRRAFITPGDVERSIELGREVTRHGA